MKLSRFPIVALLLLAGCSAHRYTIVGESDTNEGIAISIMKVPHSGAPSQLYYTELTRNDTEFVYDQKVSDQDARVEAWFELKKRPGDRVVYALSPDRRIRVKLDTHHGSIVVEETKIEKEKKHH